MQFGNPYNPYLGTYQPTVSMPSMQPSVPSYQSYQPPFDGITKVNGPESAMRRQLPPNSTSEPMFDSNGKVFYVVSTDGTGSKSMETFDYFPHVEVQQPPQPNPDYVTREEFQAFVERITHGTDGPLQATAEQAR